MSKTPMHRRVKVSIKGLSPLLVHNGHLADPTNLYVKKMKEISPKRKKTDQDFETLKKLEFEGGLYFDEQAGPYIPDTWIEKNIRDGATANKLGKAMIAGVQCEDYVNPLEYDGPRTIEELYADPRFVDVRGVVVARQRIMRTRPRFPDWGCTFILTILTEVVTLSSVETALARAGMVVGLGDYRPKFGRYELTGFTEL